GWDAHGRPVEHELLLDDASAHGERLHGVPKRRVPRLEPLFSIPAGKGAAAGPLSRCAAAEGSGGAILMPEEIGSRIGGRSRASPAPVPAPRRGRHSGGSACRPPEA